ncbi:hypothetical protein CPHO_08750 [Corynebacterium phocae]|uniref:Uncharacterized protein n=1 Tax=Corynebacterium phocae TaxID=161895 RepID=A0A1L7D4W8_9CORY|nr:gephyrin-like molybdotransferase receptor GlpR [Corynebacterium phocae]APT92962.1 hypothetical protein CPHO_08750 [Corynebacterium phocae]KAA8723297.1 hypothetical protein F4V58_08255 [Corynebacterium phocae]
MPTSAIIILIIVVWLFVLAPWLLRFQKPVSHTGEGFEDTRVLFSGGSGKVQAKPRPRLRPEDVRKQYVAEDSEGAEEQEQPSRGSSFRTAMSRARSVVIGEVVDPTERNRAAAAESSKTTETVDGELVDVTDLTDFSDGADAGDTLKAESGTAIPASHGLENQAEQEEKARTSNEADDLLIEEPARTKPAASEKETDAEIFAAPVVATATSADAYAFDETFTSPVDLLYPGAVDHVEPQDATEQDSGSLSGTAVPASQQLEDDAQSGASQPGEDFAELSPEEVAFAQRRKGRGGWDPVADNAARATRFQRRQRALLALVAVLVLCVGLGIVVGGWAWAAAVVSGLVLGWYLIALRNLTLAEQALHRRRVAQLRRARLGVRNAADEELAIPRKLRRPGAIVLESDDESPDFEFLPTYSEDSYDPGEADVKVVNRRDFRDDLSARRVG